MIAVIKRWFCKHDWECISGSGSTYRCRKCGEVEGLL